MAFLPPEQENNLAPTGTTGGTQAQGTGTPPPQSGGSTGAGAGTAKAGAPQSAGTSTQFGSSASKLGDYLTANAPQITQEASGIANNLNSGYGQIGTDINNAANQFGQTVNAGYTAPNQDLVNQATSNPTGFVSNPADISGFQAQYNDQYTGPQNYESTTPYQNINSEVTNAVQNAQAFQTPAGLQSYLAGTGGNNQTQASTTLDQLLLNGNPQAQSQIQQAAQQYSNLTPQFQQSVTQADALVPAAQAAAQQASQYAQGQFGNAVTGFNTNLNNEYNTAQTADTNYNNQVSSLRDALQSGNLSNAQGVDPGLLNYLNGTVNPWFATNAPGYKPTYNYLNALPSNTNPQAPTYGDVASSQDYATLAALNQLTGQNITSPLDASTISQAGTYNIPTVQPVNNQLIAQDILNGFTAPDTNNINVGANQYHTYLNDVNALNKYLGNNQNAFGSAGNDTGSYGNPYGLAVPTIS